jgi:hypothetical protein
MIRIPRIALKRTRRGSRKRKFGNVSMIFSSLSVSVMYHFLLKFDLKYPPCRLYYPYLTDKEIDAQ